MNPDPLAQLRDIHAAANASWWPPAAGWWMLFLLLLLALIFVSRYFKARRKVKQRRQQMLGWIDLLNVLVDPKEQPQAYLSGVNRVFKVVALKAFPAENCAALSGSAWVAFLREKLENQSATEPLQALASGPFDPRPEFDAAAICELGRDWINRYG
jgi:hypothetical protein